MQPYLAEMAGTALLVLFGDGVVANVLLKGSKGNNSGWIVITAGWAMAVTLGVYTAGRMSGGHLNPAVSIALACVGAFDWAKVPGYIAAQMTGAMIGAVLVWLAYLPHWAATEDQGAKLGVFCTAPAIRNTPANFICEVIGTAVLLFVVMAIGANETAIKTPGDIDLALLFNNGVKPLLVGCLIFGLGLSLGGPTGYSLNPARDLGPRIMHAILPVAGKGGSDWGYSWIPVLGPVVGAVIGAVLFVAIRF